MRNILVSIPALVLIISSCASVHERADQEFLNDHVVSRIDDLSSRPEWLKEAEVFRVEGGTVESLGQTTIPADNRIEAAYRIAENNAKHNLASAIEQRMSFIFQTAEEGTGMDANQVRFIGGEVSNLTTSSLGPGKRYWEKVVLNSDSGQRKAVYRVFASVSMPEADFKEAVMSAIRKRQGRGGLSEDFEKKVNAHWEQLTAQKSGQTE